MKKPEHSSKIHPSLDKKPGVSNWVDAAGNLPEYIDAVAKHIFNDSPGISKSHAIAAAVQKCKRDAAKGNARAIKSLAEWEAKKASRHLPGKKPVDKKSRHGVELAEPVKGKRVGAFRSVGGVRSAVAGEHVKRVHRGTSQVGSNRKAFDESKVVRSFGGKFGEKLDASSVNSARRIVESAILALQVGRSVNLPNGIGWVQRTAGGYVIQGDAGTRVVVRTASEAVQAAASVLASKIAPKNAG